MTIPRANAARHSAEMRYERKAAHGASVAAPAKVRKATDRTLAALDKAIDAAREAVARHRSGMLGDPPVAWGS